MGIDIYTVLLQRATSSYPRFYFHRNSTLLLYKAIADKYPPPTPNLLTKAAMVSLRLRGLVEGHGSIRNAGDDFQSLQNGVPPLAGVIAY